MNTNDGPKSNSCDDSLPSYQDLLLKAFRIPNGWNIHSLKSPKSVLLVKSVPSFG